jgi:hypothetical protein
MCVRVYVRACAGFFFCPLTPYLPLFLPSCRRRPLPPPPLLFLLLHLSWPFVNFRKVEGDNVAPLAVLAALLLSRRRRHRATTVFEREEGESLVSIHIA